ncbi:PP2C family protein-serine/threonine phosphatase [Spirilliplanes yamanashiensis]|uniref:Uncharacterized protein n=1 Tax=Spirilliplanes yamanashiensis TaxID=42233 RepID=A0A8J3Y7Z9_9ACTN|nr:PP2C family protein-serine/threonine phosphatase [Spirilliplanes yamanashiensis]MDP9817401.1 serine phosphatase RsbU (regulator of sigma subunit) [Spirilliplanes yamanashiensis]GIJ02948.1 hypothetical protein Sya03_23000 [Spirilliplanes yamanashiensis]
MERQQRYADRLAEIEAKVRAARPADEVLVAQASGLLAGRVGCRVDEAEDHLLRLAAERGTGPAEVAAELLAGHSPGGPRPEPFSPALVPAPRTAPARTGPSPGGPAPGGAPAWAAGVREVLDCIPGRHTLLEPVRDAAGGIADFAIVAVSPEVRDEQARRGRPDVVGLRVGEIDPTTVDGPAWKAWVAVAGDGRPREVGPVPYPGRSETDPAQMLISSRIRRVGPGVLTSWVRHDEEDRLAERAAQTERLGNLGWGESDLVTGEITWSPGLYRIYERDPELGPLPPGAAETLTVPEDAHVHRRAAEQFGRGETVDISYRIRVGGRLKHLRAVVDAVRDVAGRPIRLYGLVQDVTATETARAELAEAARQLREQRQNLAAEHRLATQLQHIVLPVPEQPVDLSGLRVALRYLPAEQANRIGGDWYHAAPAEDGTLILAVGDVAGHGIQAATAMAQLRHTLAALTLTTTSDPAQLLGHLNRLLCSGRALTETATAVIARYDPCSGRVRWAQAGHPAPLLAHGGVTAELPRPDGVMLGVLDAARYATAELALDLGDLLVLYTDGLTELRDHNRADGLPSVLRTIDGIAAADTGHPLADLLGRLHRANPDDDTCILAARRLAATASGR